MGRYLYSLPFILLFILPLSSQSQELFWVGGSGDWNDPSHWAHQSGGNGGAGPPGDSTDVVFDGNSFPDAGQTVSISGQASCKDFEFQASGSSIYIAGSPSSQLDIFGDFNSGTLSELNVDELRFRSDRANTAIAAGSSLLRTDLTFSGTGGWILQEDLHIDNEHTIDLVQGKIVNEDHRLKAGTFRSKGPSERKLLLGKGSELEIRKGVSIQDTSSFRFAPNGGKVLIDEGIPKADIQLSGLDQVVQAVRDNGATSCNFADCINEVSILPQDTALKNGYDLSCPDSCDGKFIAVISDSSGCSSSASFSYDWTISGSYQEDDSLAWGVCNQANIEVQITNDNTGQFCKVGYSLEVPFKLKKFTDSKTQPSCPGDCDGDISYVPTDGVTPYEYQWENGDTTQTTDSLCSGDHTLLVTDDNGCKLQDTLTLNDPPTIDPGLVSTDARCAGVCDGTAKVEPTGGNGGPYEFEWSTGSNADSIDGLCAGSYSVTVYDQDSCSVTTPVTIDEPAPIQIDVDSTQDLTCYQQCDGWVSMTVSDGTPPYSYEWFDANTGGPIAPQQDTSFPTNLCAGDYYMEVTDANGCQESSDTITLDQPDPLTSNSSSSDVLCNGDCNGEMTLDTVHGATPPYSYEWFDGSGNPIGQTDSTATGLCAGDYYAEITDANGCELHSDTLSVDEPPALNLSPSHDDILCNGDCSGEAEVAINGGVLPYSVEWFDGGGNPIGITDSVAPGLCAGDYYAVVTDANSCSDTTDTISVDEPSELNTSLSGQDVTCNGDCDGEASVSVSGGVSPYDFEWFDANTGSSTGQTSMTATGLCPGEYYAVIEDDNGCLDSTDTVTIQEPPPLDVSLSVDHISCAGDCDGSITPVVSGGTGDYSFQWFNAGTGAALSTDSIQTNLCSGDYYVEVTDDNGCTINSADSTVTEPPSLSISTNSVQASCYDSCNGMAIADVSGGTAPYSYSWSDGSGNPIPIDDDTISGLCAGTYNVSVVDDNGCSVGPENVNVGEPPELDPSLTLQDASCNGDCDGEASVSMSGGTPGYSYSWSTGGTGNTQTSLCGGTHSVTITDANGCDTTVDFTIDEPPILDLDVNTDSVSCNGDCDGEAQVLITGGTEPYDVQWLDDAGNPIPGETDTFITGLCPGDYGVEVTDNNGCGTSNTSLTIEEPAGLTSNLSVTDVSCNGACDGSITANISGGTSPYSYQWYDAAGFPLGNGQTIDNLCPGDYYVDITDDHGCTFSSDTVTVTQPPALSLTTSGSDISCYGACDGEVYADVSGGTPPYSYNWTNNAGSPVGSSDTLEDLCEDSYTLNVVDDNGCTIGPQTIDITEPDSLEAVLSKEDVSCNGDCDGSAEVSVSGGTTPYSFSWSTGATDSTVSGLCAGTQDVTVTDANGCDTTVQFSIDEPAPLDVTVSTNDPSCAGICDGSASISISGGTTPYDIQWYDDAGNPIPGDTTMSVSGYCDGDYSVEVVDSNSCSSSVPFQLDAPQVMTVDIDSTQNASCGTVCDGAAWITVSGGAAPYSYNWIDATTGNSTGMTEKDPDTLCSGNYYVNVTDDNGCVFSSDTITINEDALVTGTSDHQDASCFGYCDGSAWVNPTGGTPPYSYTWTNTSTGDTIGSTDSISGLCDGSYAVTITDDPGCSSAPIMVNVGEASPLTLSTDSTRVSCSGGSDGAATVTPSGGTPPYSYQWDAAAGNQTDSMATGLSAGTYSVTVSDSQGCSSDTAVTVIEPAPVVAGLSIEGASCNGNCNGSAELTPSGGTIAGNYDFQWYDSGGNPIPGATADSLDDLCADSYAVTVTDDNGCTDSVNFTIGQPSPLDVSIANKNDISCNGADDGSVTASVSGGNSPYSFQWNDPSAQTGATASGLSPGTYKVVVTDDEGCQDSVQVDILEPAPLDFDTSSVDVSCAGDCDGMAIVDTIMGGTPPYTIQWDDPLSQNGDTAYSLCPGNYEVTITDANGCDTSGTLSIGEPPSLDINVDTVIDPTCAGGCDGSVEVTTSGGSGSHSFTWTDLNSGTVVSTAEDPTGLCEGSYELTVNDANGCIADTVLDLNAPPAMSASFETQEATCGACDGWIDVDVSNGAAPLSYSWSPAPGGGAGTDSIYDLCADVYTVEVTDADGCTRQFTTSLSNVSGEDTEMDSTLMSCANTCDGTATVTLVGGCSDPNCSIEWLDSTGAPIGQNGTSASGLCEGLYYAEVNNGSGCITLDSVRINSPDPITPDLLTEDANCGGDCDGEASVDPSGGTAPYSYSWSAGTTPSDSLTGGLCAGNHSVTITDANGCDTTLSFDIDEPPVLSILAKDSSDVSCNGASDGSATVFPNGGDPGYTYQWFDCASNSPIGQNNQMATGLSGGSYYAVVTDNSGCTVTSSCIQVDEPAPLDVDASPIQHISCNGADDGMAEVEVSGGSAPYSYDWTDDNGNPIAGNDTVIDLAPGTYAAVITDADGCQGVDSVTIDEPAPLSASMNSVAAGCNGSCDGELQVSVSGGVIPYSYQWYDEFGNPISGATNATLVECAGTYSVEVQDGNGCTLTLTDSILEPPELDLTSSTDSSTCGGACDGSATVHASGGNGAPYNYQWLDSLQNPISGETDSTLDTVCKGEYYTVVDDGAGCADTLLIEVPGPDSLLATTSSNNSTCGDCNGSATVNPTGGTAPYTYQWDASAGNQTTPMASGLCSGIYTVLVTDDAGCSETFTAAVSDDGGEDLNSDSLDVSCYGACDGEAIVDYTCNDAPCSVDWFDAATGAPIGQNEDTADGLCAGDYYAEVVNGSGCTSIQEVTVDGPAPLEANGTVDDISCAGLCDGEISVTPSGGNGGYSYTWTDGSGAVIGNGNSISTLCSGTYEVEITDANGCDTSYSFNIDEPAPLSGTMDSTDLVCNGDCDGEASVSPSGGVSPYSYQWSDSGGPIAGATDSTIDGLCAGTYSVELSDANGCDTTLQVSIDEPAPIQSNMDQEDLLCNGDCNGSAWVDPTGGSGNYSYQWYGGSGVALPGETDSLIDGLCQGDVKVLVEDGDNCLLEDSTTIVEPAPLAVSFDSIAHPGCNGGCDGMTSVTASGGTPGSSGYEFQWYDGSGNPIPNSDTSYMNALCGGSYSIEVIDSSNCTSINDTTLIEPTPITADLDSTDADCGANNGAITVTNVSGGSGNYSYQWYDNAMNPIGTGTSISGLAAGVYNLDITDDSGCSEDFSIAIEDVDGPTISLDSIDAVSCSGGDDGAIHVSVSGGTPPYEYLWNPGGTQSEDLTQAEAGSYLLEVVDDSGCTAYLQDSIPAADPLIPNFATSDASCGDCNGEAFVSINGGSTPYSYQWSNGSTADTAADLCAGVHSVQVTDSLGCQENFDVSIDDNGGPGIDNISTSPVSCFGDCDGEAEVTAMGGTPPYEYYWVHDGTDSSYHGNLCAGTYHVQIEDDSGCKTTATVNIPEPTPLSDSTNIFPTTCGACDGVIDLHVQGGTPPYTYNWSNGATSSTVTGLCQGIYTVTVEDNSGCSQSFTYALEGDSVPNVSTSAIDASCNGLCDGEATASVPSNPDLVLEWYDDTGSPIGQSGTNATGLCAGDYIVEVEDTTTDCKAFDQVTIEEPDSLQFNLPNTQDVSCYGACDGTATVSYSGGTMPYSVQWSPTGDNTDGINGLCADTHSVQLTDANGCSIERDVIIDEPAPIEAVLDSMQEPECPNSGDGAIWISVSGGEAPYSYDWSGPGGFSSSSQNINGLDAGQYIVEIEGDEGCSNEDTIILDPVTPVEADAGPDTSICEGDSLLLVGSGNVTGGEWLDTNEDSLSSGDSLSIAPSASGPYYYVAHNAPCSDTDTVVIDALPLPTADAGPDATMITDEEHELGGEPTGPNGADFVWSPSLWMTEDSTNADPSIIPTEAGEFTYTVEVIAPNGCRAIDSVSIQVRPDLAFPDGFTPNGDGVNDVWEIDRIKEFPDATVEVYNRWGEQLFYSEGYDEPWDGTYNGKDVPVGTYYYVIDLNDPEAVKETYTGPLTIIR